MLKASLLCLTALGCRVQGLQNKAGHFLLSALQAGIHAGQLCSQQHQDTLRQVLLEYECINLRNLLDVICFDLDSEKCERSQAL